MGKQRENNRSSKTKSGRGGTNANNNANSSNNNNKVSRGEEDVPKLESESEKDHKTTKSSNPKKDTKLKRNKTTKKTAEPPRLVIGPDQICSSLFMTILPSIRSDGRKRPPCDEHSFLSSDEWALFTKFRREFKKRLLAAATKDCPFVGIKQFGKDAAKCIKLVFELTCRTFQHDFAELFGENFLEDCIFIGCPEVHWWPVLDHILDIELDRPIGTSAKIREKQQELWVTTELAKDLRHACWECKEASDNDLLVCSKCHVALYCCKECQVSAWKDGHKTKCYDLLGRHTNFVEALEYAAKQVTTGEIDGLIVHPDIAFSVAFLFCDENVSKRFVNKEGTEGPKIEYFYKNLAAIHRGEWWLYSRPSTTEEYESTIEHRSELHNTYKTWIMYQLCFDLEGLAKKKMVQSPASDSSKDEAVPDIETIEANDHLKVDSRAIEAVLDPRSPVLLMKIRTGGLSMPVEVFMKGIILERAFPRLANPRQLAAEMLKFKCFALSELRENSHK